MWLFDTTPKKVLKTTTLDGPTVENVAIDDAISRELTFLLQDSWTPSFAACKFIFFNLKFTLLATTRAKQYYADTYSISTCDLVYPSKGRKIKTTQGIARKFTENS
jgi:hypothetical protein